MVVSILGWSVFAVTAVLYFVFFTLLWLLTLPLDPNKLVLHTFTGVWLHMYFWVHPGWHLRIEGRQKLPWRGPAIIVANHQSLLDAVVMFMLLRPFKPISKTSVKLVPIIGWAMMMSRYIGLKRGSLRSVAEMLRTCCYWLGRGVPIMIYPEGRRSRDGQLQPFHDGAFTLAVEAGCPVYPVVITGTADALPPDSALLGLYADVRVRVLDPIHPTSPQLCPTDASKKQRVAALRDRVRQIMLAELARVQLEQRSG